VNPAGREDQFVREDRDVREGQDLREMENALENIEKPSPTSNSSLRHFK
jgi:hypothetical protein